MVPRRTEPSPRHATRRRPSHAGHRFAAATVSAAFTIAKGRTVTTLASSKNPSDFGQDVTFTATVAAANPGPVAPAGQVRFLRSTIGLGTRGLDAVGHSALTVPILQVGQNPISATHGGDDFFLDSSGTLTQTVTCSRTLTGTQNGGLNLTAGSTCITNATVNGSITIAAGAAVSITTCGCGPPTVA
ncbi:Ig-like domain-containing protein [Dactylosporangium sp. McL0621]|uniref:Ig-like domain-containing protein n=1 Tax=Dactylosporangium sp. McL0621 TaxID=3415678 RepID=UPI003CF728EC